MLTEISRSAIRARLPRFAIERTADAEVGMPPEQHEQLRWAEELLRLPEVWTKTKGVGVRVAILDTGIDKTHPDLEGAVVATKDFTGSGMRDVNGHGTHCAGIIGARANGIGFIGVAPEVSLMIGKVLGNDGSGDLGWISAGIDWAVANGADIISMSLGAEGDDPDMYRSIHRALALNKIIVCAAGNAGAVFADNIGFPGRYGSVITVASHDGDGNPSGFSSRGGSVDFMAPGHEIWSTWPDGQYAQLSGTSMATPFVAGLAALILSKHRQPIDHGSPIVTNEDMRAHLMRMAAHPGWHDSARGYGPLLPFAYFA